MQSYYWQQALVWKTQPHGRSFFRARYLWQFYAFQSIDSFVQSVSQTLHTCTPFIFTTLLNYYLSSPANSKLTYTLLRRSLTALIHHVDNADQFSILSETILQQVLTIFKQENHDAKMLRRALDVCSILLGVRQGSRLRGQQTSRLYITY